MVEDKELERIREKKKEELLKKIRGKNEIITKIDVTDADFQEKVIEKSKEVPVVVDFWAVWCMPCLMISPVLEKLSEEHKGKFVLAKVNVDENPMISRAFGIMSIPTVKMFKDGKIVDEFIGAIPEPAIRQWLERNINK